jgi:hypothetical protein
VNAEVIINRNWSEDLNDPLVCAGQYYDDNGYLQAQSVECGPDQARFIPSKA